MKLGQNGGEKRTLLLPIRENPEKKKKGIQSCLSYSLQRSFLRRYFKIGFFGSNFECPLKFNFIFTG
jgi:hypothetical protein